LWLAYPEASGMSQPLFIGQVGCQSYNSADNDVPRGSSSNGSGVSSREVTKEKRRGNGNVKANNFEVTNSPVVDD